VSKEQILEREGRWARPAAIATIAGVVLYLGSIVIEQAGGLVETANDAKQLVSYQEHSSALLATSVVRAIGALLLSVPLFYLFKAAEARSEPELAQRRRGLVAFAFIGPVFFALQNIVAWIGLHDAANQFTEQAGGALNGNLAQNLIDDSGTLDAATSLAFPAILGLLIAMIYIPLQALRQGLLTRLTGTLGMALGAAIFLLGPTGLIALLVWFLYVGLLIGGWLPTGRPPAWAAGEGIPWPAPDRGSGLFGGGRGAPPPADAVEGTGREIGVEGGDGAVAPGLPQGEGEVILPGETQGQRRKKRKRRG
jgi:hypothetical protein